VKTGRIIRRLALAIWFGGGVILSAVAAPAAFRHAPDSHVAGDIVGAMLGIWHWIAVLAPVVVIVPLVARRGRLWLALVILALVAAGAQRAVDVRISAMRMRAPVPIRSLAPDDPLRRRFGALHGISVGLMGLNILAAGALLVVDAKDDAR